LNGTECVVRVASLVAKRFIMRRGISKRRARELNSTMKERKKQTLRDREEFNALFNAIMTKNVALVRQKLASTAAEGELPWRPAGPQLGLPL
jgi:hypothetical protein